MSHRKSSYRPLRLERLEARQMMAGDVTAALVDGNLVITGDELGNGIDVMFLNSDNEWRLTGVDAGGGATTINGQSEVVFDADELSGDFLFNLMGGDDSLRFNSDFDSFGTYAPRDVIITTGDGDDFVKLIKTGVGDDLVINTGAGDDVVDMNLVVVGDLGLDGGMNNMIIKTGAGSDLVDLFVSGASANVSIDTGANEPLAKGDVDADAVGLFGFFAGEQLTVKTGEGNDLVYLDTAVGGKGINLNTGDGDDELIIEVNFGETDRITDGNLDVELGAGDDSYSEGKFTVGGTKTIRDSRTTPVETNPLDRFFNRLGKEERK